MNDLLSETIEYVGKKIHKKFNNKILDKYTIKNCKLQDLFLVTPEYLLPYLEFLRENKAIYKIAYSQPNVLKEQYIVSHLFKNIFEPILDRFLVPREEQRYMMSFYINGISAVMIEWIRNDCKEENRTILNILTKCLNLGDNLCQNGVNS